MSLLNHTRDISCDNLLVNNALVKASVNELFFDYDEFKMNKSSWQDQSTNS
jgi:hypothetical protein